MSSYYDGEFEDFKGCPIVNRCANNQCIFRREQIFKLTCWATQYKYFYDHCTLNIDENGIHTIAYSEDGKCVPGCIRDHSKTTYPSGVEESTKIMEDLNLKYGPQIDPTICVMPKGTNRWMLVCKDFKDV